VTANSQDLGIQAVLDNLSAEGCYLRIARAVEENQQLVIISQVAQAVVMLRGHVLRIEELTDGAYGLAIAITQHQIFSLKNDNG
jgi:hypothetical protein